MLKYENAELKQAGKFSNMFPIFLKFQKMLIICESQHDVQKLIFFYQGRCFNNANQFKGKYAICEIQEKMTIRKKLKCKICFTWLY